MSVEQGQVREIARLEVVPADVDGPVGAPVVTAPAFRHVTVAAA
ncbi:hypothetical protein [Pseudonocardia ailaonensis]